MQLLNLKLKHSNIFSPATGEPISIENEGLNDTISSFIGLWHHEEMLNPKIKNSKLPAEFKLQMQLLG